MNEPFPSSPIEKSFASTEGAGKTGRLHVRLWPTVPQAELSTTGGQSCILKGEDFGKFIAWMKELGFHV
jgi:hypothetical protein